MKTLVAIKDETCAAAVIRVILEQIRREGTIVRLLTVVDPYPVALAEADGSKEHPDFVTAREQQRAQATALLETTAAGLESGGFDRPTFAIREGQPWSEIIDEAEQWRADVIVVGSHGHANLLKRFVGSVSTIVARDASCTVEIVRITA
jgi:nucleotide-binding universal stress UspA family protein